MTDLLALVMTVQPLSAALAPAYLGRAVYAQVMRWIASADAALAERLHDDSALKPLTCSSLMGGGRAEGGMRALQPDKTYWLRITALDAPTCAALLPLAADPPARIELDGIAFAVTGATCDADAHRWAGSGTYDGLAAPYLLARASAPRRVRLGFASAVSFRQRERGVPLPLPELVFGGLADRWNAFSTVGISPEVRAFCQDGLSISRFSLRSRAVPVKAGVVQIGAVGTAEYAALRYDRYWMSVVALLADFAFFAGVGRMTTMGMGQTRRLA